VLDEQLTVASGAGALRIIRVQLAGRPAMAADAFLRGHPVPAGTILGG
jgi:methionyl-tRNA formyltransferase